MANQNHYDALLQNSKKQEKRIHDFANHFSILHYLIRNQHFIEADHYIQQLISEILELSEDDPPFEHYKKYILYQLYKLKALIPTHLTDEMLAHFKEIHQELESMMPEVYCDHSLLNAVFIKKMRVAIEYHIDLKYSISLPAKMGIPDIQILSIFFNLLDNAIDACKQSSVQRPFICLKTVFKGNMLSIHMTNSKNCNISFTGKSTKEDSQNHGYGLQIIEDIIRPRFGYSQWIDHGNVFESLIMFDIMQDDPAHKTE